MRSIEECERDIERLRSELRNTRRLFFAAVESSPNGRLFISDICRAYVDGDDLRVDVERRPEMRGTVYELRRKRPAHESPTSTPHVQASKPDGGR